MLENLHLLFNDTGEYQKVRYHYWRTLGNLLTLSYSKITKDWCEKYNLKLTGHLMGEDSFISQLQYYRDRHFLPVNISHLVSKGINYIELSRDFQPAEDKVLGIENLDRFYGTELEQIYLIGEFAVKGEYLSKDSFETDRHRYSPKFSLTAENQKTKGDLLTDGYCFFNGTIDLISEIDIPEINDEERYYLQIDNLETVNANIEINNSKAGSIAWKPYKLDITELVWKGNNRIVISLTNSLRNLMGEIHFIPLEEEKFSSQWSLKVTPRLADGPNWFEKRKTGKLRTWSDDYFFRPFGIYGSVSIICEA